MDKKHINEDKMALVTGSTRGLGLAIASRLLHDGYKVILTGRALSESASALVKSNSQNCFFYSCNLENTEQIYPFIREVVEAHGTLYALVNNAAIGLDGVLTTMHESQIETMIRVNITAPIVLAKYCSRSMLLRRSGRIVNVSSIVASTGFSGLSVYAATKSAMVGFTRSLARELGKAGITVNAVSPGFMETDMTSELSKERLNTIRRRTVLGLPEVSDVSAAVAYLLSPDAGRVTGTNLVVDGGSTA